MERQNANAARGFAAREKILAEREKGLIAREVKVSAGGYEARNFVNVATEVIGLGLAYSILFVYSLLHTFTAGTSVAEASGPWDRRHSMHPRFR